MPPALRARLAVVADGAASSVPGIARRRHDYGQVAIVAKIALERPHGGVAYERFTADGPVALLPERDHYALVWTRRGRGCAARRWRCPKRHFSRRSPRISAAACADSRMRASGARFRWRSTWRGTRRRLRSRRHRQRGAGIAPGRWAGLQSGPSRRVGSRAWPSSMRRATAIGSAAMLERYRAPPRSRPACGHRVHARTCATVRQRLAVAARAARRRHDAARYAAACQARVRPRDAVRRALTRSNAGRM